MRADYKSGFVTLIGRPNVGKSTLMNHLIGQKIAITSNKPQTTRNRIQTVYTCEEGQIVFLDTPGILWPKFDDQKVGLHIAMIGSINEDILDQNELAMEVMEKIALKHNLVCLLHEKPFAGVSGSGKSSLVGDILYPALYRHINQTGSAPGTFRGLSGSLDRITQVEYVDQNPIGKSSRSNAVTYLKVYDDIRKLLSDQQYAKLNGYTPSHFSFNIDGGRCPECQGEGFVKIGMQFMADVSMVCEACGGKRFKPDILEVRYKGKNIDDILNMSVEEAMDFFSSQEDPVAKRIAERLQPLVDVGLSYIKLGQSSSTLSGGESQRVKLAYFLSMNAGTKSRPQRILFIFDEPTTGLHFYDVEKLLKSFDALLAKGHSIVVVEHNMDVIKAADWVIDLGPEAGDGGGSLVFTGTPEDLACFDGSHTAEFMKED